MSAPEELFQQGKLTEAIAAQTAVVKARPGDVIARTQLVELLCISGNLERADTQLEAVLAQSPAHLHGAALLRQLIRAEQARRDFWTAGRVPEFTAPPSEPARLALEASIRLRERDFAGAAALLAAAAEARAALPGSIDGRPFDDLIDLDDRTSGVIEVLTPTGKYYWLEFAQVERIEFEAPERGLDLCWRAARIDVRSGPSGAVYVPAVYAPAEGDSDAHRLARATDWVELAPGGPTRGQGQRMWLAGDDATPLLEIGVVEFAARA